MTAPKDDDIPMVDSPGLDAAMEADRAWFDAHPERWVRLRLLIPGEFDLPDHTYDETTNMEAYTMAVMVAHVAQGVRMRQPLALEHPGLSQSDLDEMPEDHLAEVWRHQFGTTPSPLENNHARPGKKH